MQSVRIVEFPECRMVSSGVGMFGEERFDAFCAWMEEQPRGVYPQDFLTFARCGEKQGLLWLYLYREGMDLPQGVELIDFPGGLYAVTTDIDQKTDMQVMNAEIDRFLRENGLRRDPSRPDLGNIITTPAVRQILGYEQMDYYTPVSRSDGKE